MLKICGLKISLNYKFTKVKIRVSGFFFFPIKMVTQKDVTLLKDVKPVSEYM
ncbi:unnamed protein product [Brassica oleracea]